MDTPPNKGILYLSLPSPDDQFQLLDKLESGEDAFTTDLGEAMNTAAHGYAVARRAKHPNTGEIVVTHMTADELAVAIKHGIELRGDPELNRP